MEIGLRQVVSRRPSVCFTLQPSAKIWPRVILHRTTSIQPCTMGVGTLPSTVYRNCIASLASFGTSRKLDRRFSSNSRAADFLMPEKVERMPGNDPSPCYSREKVRSEPAFGHPIRTRRLG